MDNKKKTYAVAMSGGVDSSVVAAILKDRGHDIFGITMYLHEYSKQAIDDAKKVCDFLGIDHYVCDLREDFLNNVIDVFSDYYRNGLTPNPCVFCNRDIKMDRLLKFGLSKGADMMATGHYVRNFPLREHPNQKKDQSYFLSLVDKNNLKLIDFPLGDIFSKDITRELAKKYGIHVAEKKDSQDICFIPNNDHKSFLKRFIEDSRGKIIHISTNIVLGYHDGINNYTIGQRKGLGISYKNPLYIIDMDPKNNIIYVGEEEFLNIRELKIRDINWLIDKNTSEFQTTVKLRSSSKKNNAIVKVLDDKKSAIIKLLENPITAICKGQICAMYDDDIVVGAGIIL